MFRFVKRITTNQSLAFAFLMSLSWMAAAQTTDSLSKHDSTAATESAPAVDESATRYALKCAGCHTVGGGKLTGPDLLATRVWPKTELAAKIKLMEPRVGPINDEELAQFLELLQDPSAAERIKVAQELASKAVAAKLDPPQSSVGMKLFLGTTPLANGGIACATCHRAGERGGSLGPDLTNLHTRSGKFAMVSAIQQSSFKVMAGTYKDKPVTAQEAVHLAEFLSSPEQMPQSSAEGSVHSIGTLVALAGFMVIISLYRKRRSDLSSRQRGMK